MPSLNYPVLCCPLPDRIAPVFVQVVSPPLGWSPLSSFLVIWSWSPSGDTRGPSVVFEAVDMPCPGPFHFSYSVDYIYDFCPLPDPDVGLSILAYPVSSLQIHTPVQLTTVMFLKYLILRNSFTAFIIYLIPTYLFNYFIDIFLVTYCFYFIFIVG